MDAFCNNCKNEVTYKEEDIDKESTYRGRRIKYTGKEAYCGNCNGKLSLQYIDDYNQKLQDKIYRKKEGLISIKSIEKLLDKYAIGKRPLSILLGWGEGTLTRYLDGDIPSKPYSDTLLEILEDSEYYRELLEQNKDSITAIAYKKSLKALERIEGNNKLSAPTSSRIESATKHLLVQVGEITPLALQKLLYFAQGFSKAFTGEFLFKEDCEAWIHGPVYPDIYKKYNDIGYLPIDMDVTELSDINLTEDEKELLDHIVLYFGCYSGKILENMTHIEEPWRNTRKGLESFEKTNEIIPKEEIASYFDNVMEKYTMLNLTDIKDYAIDLFGKISL